MTANAFKFISDCLDSIGVPYEFMEWNGDIPEIYFIGDYTEEESMSEDGQQKTVFRLTGTTRGSWFLLERTRVEIEKLFKCKTAILECGTGVAVFYAHSFPVPTDTDDIKRIQINLNIKEWKVT